MALVHRRTRTPLTADEHVGRYGPGRSRHTDDGEHFLVYDRVGVLTDHLASFVEAGGTVRVSDTGVTWAVLPDGRAHRVLCGEIIPIWTEDGSSDGRCGAPVTSTGLCVGHS